MAKTLAKVRLEMDQGGRPPLGWRPEEPWDIIWGRVLRDKEFWSEEVHVPAISWTPMEELADATSSYFLEDDPI